MPDIRTDLSHYQQLQQSHALFVDKTALLQNLVKRKRVFLAWLDGWGKTMLVSLLEELFIHGTQHFEHLAIAALWQEQQYQVLKLSFLHLRDPATFEQELCAELRAACYHAGFHDIYDFIPECNDFNILFLRVISEVLKEKYVVVLIDDWDTPLTSNLHDRAAFEANSAHLRAFSTWLQARKNVCFAPHLARSAARYHLSEEAMLKQLRSHYGNFCLDEMGQVHLYHPLALNRFFAQVTHEPNSAPPFKPFGLQQSAAPNLLLHFLRAYHPAITSLEPLKADGIKLSQQAISAAYHSDDMSLVKLLLQT